MWIFIHLFYTVAEDFYVKYFFHIVQILCRFLVYVYAISLFSQSIKRWQVVKFKKTYKFACFLFLVYLSCCLSAFVCLFTYLYVSAFILFLQSVFLAVFMSELICLSGLQDKFLCLSVWLAICLGLFVCLSSLSLWVPRYTKRCLAHSGRKWVCWLNTINGQLHVSKNLESRLSMPLQCQRWKEGANTP